VWGGLQCKHFGVNEEGSDINHGINLVWTEKMTAHAPAMGPPGTATETEGGSTKSTAAFFALLSRIGFCSSQRQAMVQQIEFGVCDVVTFIHLWK